MGTSQRAGRQPLSDPSLVRFRAVIEAGLVALEERREEVNELNLAGRNGSLDGDTGDNMALTLRAVLEELDRLADASEGRTLDEIGRDEIVASVARAALLGARGSSGVILSQLIRGAAEELASRPGELIDPVLIAAALGRAADQAYGSVRDPAEGTILTVVREMAYRVASELAHRPEARLRPETTALEQDLAIADVIQSALQAGGELVGPGPQRSAAGPQPRPLRGAGVVDAGGYGVIVLMAGIVAALRGTGLDAVRPAAELPVRAGRSGHTSITYRYCTTFAVTGRDLSPRALRPGLEAIGDAVLVVGDATTLKVHLHTDDPQAATALFAPRPGPGPGPAAGEVSHLDVTDMREPVTTPAASRLSGLVAIADGAGLRELFEGFGARVLAAATPEGLAAAITSAGADEVLILPNSAQVSAVAELAASRAAGPVVVVATDSPQAGLAAASVHSPAQRAAENATAMAAAVARMRTGSVGAAEHGDPDGRFAAGDAVGLVDGELVVWGEPATTLREVLARLGAGAEVVSVISGTAPPLDDEAVRALVPRRGQGHSGPGVAQSVGGQSSPWWLLSAV